MSNKDNKDEKKETPVHAPKPDPETLHTTDPQENMEGPVSSAMRGLSHAFETDETKKEADEKRDRHM